MSPSGRKYVIVDVCAMKPSSCWPLILPPATRLRRGSEASVGTGWSWPINKLLCVCVCVTTSWKTWQDADDDKEEGKTTWPGYIGCTPGRPWFPMISPLDPSVPSYWHRRSWPCLPSRFRWLRDAAIFDLLPLVICGRRRNTLAHSRTDQYLLLLFPLQCRTTTKTSFSPFLLVLVSTSV